MGCCTEKICGERVLVKTLELGDSGAYGSGSGGTAKARVGIPSVLIHCTLLVWTRNLAGGLRTYGASEKWQITPQAVFNGDQPLTPVFVNGSDVATTRPLPDSYEVETGIKAAEVSVVIASSGAAGKYWLQAIFEPAVGGIPQDELDQMFANCELNLLGKYIHAS